MSIYITSKSLEHATNDITMKDYRPIQNLDDYWINPRDTLSYILLIRLSKNNNKIQSNISSNYVAFTFILFYLF